MTNINKPPATNLLNTERTKSTSLIIEILASARLINEPKHFGQSSEGEILVQDSAFHNFLKLFDEFALEKDESCLKIWLTSLKILMEQVKSIVEKNKIETITQFSDQFLLQAIQAIEAGKFSSFNLHWSQKLRDNLSNRKLLPDNLNPLKEAAIAKQIDRPALMPSEGVLELHELHRSYTSFAEFLPELTGLLQQGSLLSDCIQVTQALGILEPFTGEHIPPEAIQIQGSNYRETLIADGLLSRNRAVLVVLEQIYGSLEALGQQEIYLVEALTGFALWLRRQLGEERLICSEFLDDAEQTFAGIPHQDLCALTFSDASFDLVLCNELFEHVQDLELAFREIARVLRPGGRLVATCPLAFGQAESIVKVQRNPSTGELDHLTEQEFHGDPVRPEAGSLVYRIPAWDVLGQLQAAGFSEARMHHIASWKHGVLGSDLPGVLVIEALRKKDDYLGSKNYINEAFTAYGKGEDIYGVLQDNPVVSILIVSYNSNSDLVECFDSILAQTYTNWEVIVVDNSDIEDASFITRGYFEERATYIKQPNIGFAAANNVAAAASKGDLLLLLNPDASLAEDAIKELVNSLRFDGSAGIVAPKIYFKKEFLKVSFVDVPPIVGLDLSFTTKEWNYKKIFLVEGSLIGNVAIASINGRISIELPIDQSIDVLPFSFVRNEKVNISEFDSICRVRVQVGRRSKLEKLEIKNLPDSKYIALKRVDFSSARKLINNAGSGLQEDGTTFDRGYAEEDHAQFSQKQYIQAFCGCCALIRRNIFAYRKLFIDELFAYYEDSELSYWCDLNNIPILYNPASRVFHRHSESTSENSPSWKCMVYRSKKIYDMIKGQEESDLYESLIADEEYAILLNQIKPQLRQKLSNFDILLKGSSRDSLITRESKKSVAVYNTYMNSYGGGEKHILSIAQELASHSDIELTIICERDFDLNHLLDYFRLNHFAAARLMVGKMTPKVSAFYDCFINSTFLSKHISLADHSYYVVSFPGREIPEALKDSYTFLHNSDYTAEWARNYWGEHKNMVLYPVLGQVNSSSKGGGLVPEKSKKNKLVISVGRYNYEGHCKNQHLIIKAFAEVLYEHPELSDWQLRVMGSVDQSVDSSRQHYEDCLQAVGKCTAIEVLANVPSDLISSSYEQAMVYVHAAGLEADLSTNPEKAEHFGIAVFDGLSNGCICISYNEGGPARMTGDVCGSKLFSNFAELKHVLKESMSIEQDSEYAEMARESSMYKASVIKNISINRAADIYKNI